MNVLTEIFDLTLLTTIGLIFIVTMLIAFLRARHCDPCLKSFAGFHVTLECSKDKLIWGVMELESTGLELRYRDSVQEVNHCKSSYILYSQEYGNIQAIYRYADDLTDENRRRRAKDVKRSFHPGPLTRLGRRIRHFSATASKSIGEIIGLMLGRLRKPIGHYISDIGETHLKNLSTSVIGHVGRAHDPMLERLVGKKVVVEVLDGEDEVHEHVGIFKNYSPDFIEILDVQFPQKQSLAIRADGCWGSDSITAVIEDDAIIVENHTNQPVLLKSLALGEAEELLNIMVNGGESVKLHPEVKFESAYLNMGVVREVDMIVPRTRCIVRHRIDCYEPQLLSNFVFDIGVILFGKSKVEAREASLRKQLANNPDSALAASNLGAILMQKQSFDEAQQWLQKAYRMRYSLPDNGRRTQMLLQELKRRNAEMPERLADQTMELAGAVSDDRSFTVQTSNVESTTSTASALFNTEAA